ncbi:Sterile alpha motif domain-containing protein [Melia azedarach]|uniref:Sterile alpha motif domain-containing protein n=1 Tax=Melia azedarach TaxID=155640 RepID=A0ACC1XDI0_MELAZ|nr:Sterile alpha motif domain-containing protein [Melia azedarach]
MDWFSWLSRTSLDPSLTYEYGIEFARNELQKEDVAYFNHEFLQSMGISVAKHRLEILKLARKEVGGSSKSFSRLVSALNKTRKNIAKRINKLIFHEVESIKSLPEPIRYQEEQWKGAILTRKYKSEKEVKVEIPAVRTRRIAKSGPLDGRVVQDKLMLNNKSMKLSGPLDRNMQEKFLFTYRSPISSGPLDGRMLGNRSPKLSGPLDKRPPSPRVYTDYSKEKLGGGGGGAYDDQTLWSTLFQDLNPT